MKENESGEVGTDVGRAVATWKEARRGQRADTLALLRSTCPETVAPVELAAVEILEAVERGELVERVANRKSGVDVGKYNGPGGGVPVNTGTVRLDIVGDEPTVMSAVAILTNAGFKAESAAFTMESLPAKGRATGKLDVESLQATMGRLAGAAATRSKGAEQIDIRPPTVSLSPGVTVDSLIKAFYGTKATAKQDADDKLWAAAYAVAVSQGKEPDTAGAIAKKTVEQAVTPAAARHLTRLLEAQLGVTK